MVGLQPRIAEVQGSAPQVLWSPQHEYTRALFASVPDPERRLHGDGSVGRMEIGRVDEGGRIL